MNLSCRDSCVFGMIPWMSLTPSTCPSRRWSGAHPVVVMVMVDVLMNDVRLSRFVLTIVGGTQVVKRLFGNRQLDGILVAMGSFRATGGSSFREMIRRTLRLWTSGRWITTCFVDTDRNEIAVALFSNKLASFDERDSFPKKGGGVDGLVYRFRPSVANTGSTDKLP
jgi:hypothetical protein